MVPSAQIQYVIFEDFLFYLENLENILSATVTINYHTKYAWMVGQYFKLVQLKAEKFSEVTPS